MEAPRRPSARGFSVGTGRGRIERLVPYAYYHQLSPRQQRIYRASDEHQSLPLGSVKRLLPFVEEARGHLEDDARRPLTLACQGLIDALVDRFGVPPLNVRVLAARPSNNWGELHGLYEPEDGERVARLTVWMRTAQRRQVVAFRTFMRTLLHEFCHHLDYEYLKLAETYHTVGFFKRESSLFRQLVASPADRGRRKAARRRPAPARTKRTARRRPARG